MCRMGASQELLERGPTPPASGDLVALRSGCIDAGVIIALSSRRINVSGNVVQQRTSLL